LRRLTLEVIQLNDILPRTPVSCSSVAAGAAYFPLFGPDRYQCSQYTSTNNPSSPAGGDLALDAEIDNGKRTVVAVADDGYAVYASIAALQALKGQGAAPAHRRPDRETCVGWLGRSAAIMWTRAHTAGRRGPDLPGQRPAASTANVTTSLRGMCSGVNSRSMLTRIPLR
jgi:hypothetical protein